MRSSAGISSSSQDSSEKMTIPLQSVVFIVQNNKLVAGLLALAPGYQCA